MQEQIAVKKNINMKSKIIPTIGALVILLLHSCGLLDDAQRMSHQEFLQSHKYAVGQATMELMDHTRERPVKTEIWYPTKDTTQLNVTIEFPFILPPTSRDADVVPGKHPLIMLSHGTGGNRISQMWLACELAGNGYIVAAVDHHGNTLDNKIPVNFVKVWDRPLDITFAIDQILTNGRWGASIDTSHIGMVGFSLGGYTAIGLAGGVLDYNLLSDFSKTKEGKVEFDLPELGDVSSLITSDIIASGNQQYNDLKDQRISAFVAMAPALGQGFSRNDQFEQVDQSLLIIGARNDERTPVHTNAKHYHELIRGSQYIELNEEVGHYIFMNEATSDLKRNAPVVFKDHESVDRAEIHKKVAKLITMFFKTEWDSQNR